MNSNPLVSVIIPNYNHARYLDERLHSVLNQTYPGFEVIILDDKSTDNSLEIISKYKDNPHISQVVVNEINSGSPFLQWRKGLDLAKGDLIWIAESDDSCDNTFLENMVKECIRDNSVVTFCKSKSIDSEGREHPYHFQDELGSSATYKGSKFIHDTLCYKNIIVNASSVIFRKNKALAINKYYESFRAVGDWLFWIEIIRDESVTFVDRQLNYFRCHDTNTTQKSERTGLAFIERKRLFDYLLEQGVIDKKIYLRLRNRDIVWIYFMPDFENNRIRADLLRMWNISLYKKIRLYIAKYRRKNA